MGIEAQRDRLRTLLDKHGILIERRTDLNNELREVGLGIQATEREIYELSEHIRNQVK